MKNYDKLPWKAWKTTTTMAITAWLQPGQPCSWDDINLAVHQGSQRNGGSSHRCAAMSGDVAAAKSWFERIEETGGGVVQEPASFFLGHDLDDLYKNDSDGIAWFTWY